MLGPAAPQVRRLVEAEIAPVIDRRQALVGALGIVDAVVAAAAWHQRRDHHPRADLERLAHEVLGQQVALLDDHAADLVAERERPGQRLRPVALEDVQVRAAHAAGADLDQGGVARHRRARHLVDDGCGARPGERGDADLFHHCLPIFGLLALLRALAQLELLDLAGRGLGQRAEHDPARRLEVGQPLAAPGDDRRPRRPRHPASA